MNPIIVFALATVVNVTMSTIRAICTIKCGKWVSALTNALCYGFYPLIVMLTAQGAVSIIVNMAITAIANFVCVWIIKLIEEKTRKDQLWRIEASVRAEYTDLLHKSLKANGLSHNYIENIGKYTMFNIYCETQEESARAKTLLNAHQAKYFVSESKIL